MRVIGIVGLLAVLAAGQDLRPRQGSGWDGFPVGAWVRIRRTAAVPGRDPLVTTWTTKLTHIGPTKLTLQIAATNALGMEHKSSSVIPRAGEAGAGETQEVRRLENQTVEAAGRAFDCTRRRTVVTGAQGKRVVTDWTARKPHVRVKRTVITYDKSEKAVLRQTMVLKALDKKRPLGSRTVRCREYAVEIKDAKSEVTGKVYSSRDVPGDIVFEESVRRENGKPVLAWRIETLGFGTE